MEQLIQAIHEVSTEKQGLAGRVHGRAQILTHSQRGLNSRVHPNLLRSDR